MQLIVTSDVTIACKTCTIKYQIKRPKFGFWWLLANSFKVLAWPYTTYTFYVHVMWHVHKWSAHKSQDSNIIDWLNIAKKALRFDSYILCFDSIQLSQLWASQFFFLIPIFAIIITKCTKRFLRSILYPNLYFYLRAFLYTFFHHFLYLVFFFLSSLQSSGKMHIFLFLIFFLSKFYVI